LQLLPDESYEKGTSRLEAEVIPSAEASAASASSAEPTHDEQKPAGTRFVSAKNATEMGLLVHELNLTRQEETAASIQRAKAAILAMGSKSSSSSEPMQTEPAAE